MKNSPYYKQAELLLKILPLINHDKELALKGGTAINFFIRELPRLSVDIDLVYLPIEDRDTTLTGITNKLKSIGNLVQSSISGVQIIERKLKNTENLCGIQVRTSDALIKIEPNTVIRGSVYEPEEITLCSKAEDIFELSLKMQCLALPDLYGGKICAALDRQHPRDLFDIKLLLENEGLTEKIRKAFLVYLISHDRPIVELLNPNMNDLSTEFEQEFTGMTENKLELSELTDTFNTLKELIKISLKDDEKNFLLSFKRKEPKWELLGLDNINVLPSVKWKQINLGRMKVEKHREAYERLEKFLIS
ncbi:MAG: hypothetical protein CR986_06510 [Ignavibacteriae bacterium]|nr:MAG: hypothetical protein CR986_06510 [Ignavibacteriota bacterium]